MLSQYFSTLVPAVCGLLVGALYRSDVGNIKQWRFPRIIRSWTSRLIGSSLASGPIPRSSTTMPNETTGDTTAINNLMTSAATGLRNRRQNNNNLPTSTTTTTTTNRSSVDGVRVSVNIGQDIAILIQWIGIHWYIYWSIIQPWFGATIRATYICSYDHVSWSSTRSHYTSCDIIKEWFESCRWNHAKYTSTQYRRSRQ